MYESPTLKKTVEAIIHPLVSDAVNQWLNQQSRTPYRIVCSPLLIETNQHEMLDGVIVVDAPESEQLKRGAERDSKSRDTIQYILDAQISRQARLSQHFCDRQLWGLDSLTNKSKPYTRNLVMTDVKSHVVSCPTCKEETLYRADNPFRPVR